MRADPAKLVHAGIGAHDDTVADVHMTRELRIVRKRRAVADDAIVRDVRICQEQIGVADPCVAAILRGAGVDRGSPAYLRSCGMSPIDVNWKRRLRSPSRVRPVRTTCGPTTVPAPARTSGPTIE